jgi:hypothetical protein
MWTWNVFYVGSIYAISVGRTARRNRTIPVEREIESEVRGIVVFTSLEVIPSKRGTGVDLG